MNPHQLCILLSFLLLVTVVSARASVTETKQDVQTSNQPIPHNEAQNDPTAPAQNGLHDSICLMIESAAQASDIPAEYFARIIWQESRFNPNAVGPITRSGQQAQGIAQFMPATANERGLLDAFDPVQALPKSAEYLASLQKQFGNLGLAAAAYNAGPGRVQRWLSGTTYLPGETRHYVLAVTGLSIDDWVARGGHNDNDSSRRYNCKELISLVRNEPSEFVTRLEQRVATGSAMPWGVQLAAGFSRERALASYAKTLQAMRSLSVENDPIMLSAVLRSRGTRRFYQARIGTETRAKADSLCNQVRQLNYPCFVLKN